MSGSDHTYSKEDDDYDDVMLPGFRFHPTDEEIVGFYLRRKVEKIPLSIELIKQVDIYKFDPWDLPRVSILGDKEWYFFCKRGRKYRNSIRPNRVTGSGFWKATGIDKPIYSSSTPGEAAAANYECIGLKKSLVYYCGSAGKGTKTDWMMHEFRLPPSNWNNNSNQPTVTGRNMNIIPEAEVWTLCRILKRNIASNKNRKVTAAATDESSKTCCSLESDITSQHMNLGDISLTQQNQTKPVVSCVNEHERDGDQLLVSKQKSVDTNDAQFSSTPSSSFWDLVINGDEQFFIKDGNGDELRSVVELPIKY